MALALHDAASCGQRVINPAQIRDFARTKLGRNKTDKVDAHLIREYAEDCSSRDPGHRHPPRCGGCANSRPCARASSITGHSGRTASAAASATASRPAWPPRRSRHFTTAQIEAVDNAIRETIGQDDELRRRCNLLLSVVGVVETLAASLLVEMPAPEVLRRSGEIAVDAGLNPSHHRSGTSIDRPKRVSPRSAMPTLRSSLYMPALSAMRYQSTHRRARRAPEERTGRLRPKQIVVAAMRKLLVICFGVLKTGKPFDAATAIPA